MCRILTVHSAEPTLAVEHLVAAPNSLANQSRADREGKSHRDGWGIAWYGDAGKRVIRSTAPACDDPQFVAAAQQARARVIVAHVRDASVGVVRRENCHPFHYDVWTFCHNGTIQGIDKLRSAFDRETLPELQAQRSGDTDSELLFHWLLSNLSREGVNIAQPHSIARARCADVDVLYAVVRESFLRLLDWCTAAELPEPTGLNIVLTDGQVLCATRFGRSLWMRSADSSGSHAALLVASEPTDDVGPWQEADDRSILTIDAFGRLNRRPL